MLKQILLLFILLSSSFIKADEKILITINQFTYHPALDSAREGFETALKKRNLIPKKVELKTSNAQGSISNAVQIAQYQASLNPDFMLAIATPSAQVSLRARHDAILAFLAVTDPVSAGLQTDKVIGVNDMPDLEELLRIAKEIHKFKIIGVVLNNGEASSVYIVEKLQKLAELHGIKIVRASVTSPTEVKLATQKLIGQVDLIYLPKDNMVVSSLESLLHVASQAKIPVIASDPTLVEKGVLLAYGCDYFIAGEQLGNMVADIIDGKEMINKIQNANINKLKINHKVANELAIIIPSSLIKEEQQ